MSDVKNDSKATGVSRRGFMKTAAVAGVAAGAVGMPYFARYASASPINLKIQTAWDAGTTGYTLFMDWCKHVGEITEGRIVVEGFPAGAIVGTFEMFDAISAGVFEGMHCFDIYWPGKMPVAVFLTSYPFALDRPDQWDVWYEALGGNEIARQAYGDHGIYFVGSCQHDLNLIHSKIPIRSFEDFQGKRIRYPGGIIADIYRAAGVSAVLLPGGEIYPALERGVIDAAEFVGAAVNWDLGFAEIAPYIIMGPATTPCLHQPVDLLSITINARVWQRIPKPLQEIFTTSVKWFSWHHYNGIQKANLEAWDKFAEAGNEVIRLTEEDVDKFRRFAPPLWIEYAKRSPLAMKAFKSQWEFMKSMVVGYYTDDDLVDEKGKKIDLKAL